MKYELFEVTKCDLKEEGAYLIKARLSPTPIRRGKQTAAPIPVRMLLPAAEATRPANVGSPEHPRSPARARSANRSVPRPFTFADSMLKVPGQKIPTENPASPASQQNNDGVRDSGNNEIRCCTKKN